MKMEWQTVIASGIVSGELLLAPQMARACDRILCYGNEYIAVLLNGLSPYICTRKAPDIAYCELRTWSVA
jgi:hypothetical protein